MPAHNAARTLEATLSGIPDGWVDEIILVDDKSSDDTVDLARRLPISLVWHPHNVGYGGNQKTCYLQALQRDADVVVMLHPDGQYEPSIIPKLDRADPARPRPTSCSGSRFMTPGGPRAGGMPWWKIVANRFLTTVENRVMGTQLSRAAHRLPRVLAPDLLLEVPWLRNSLDFVFDTELLMQASHFGFRFHEVPVQTKYFDEASSATLQAVRSCTASRRCGRRRLVLHRNHVWRSRKFMPCGASYLSPWPDTPSGRGSSTRRRSSTPGAASSSPSSRGRSRSPRRRAAATPRATRRSRSRCRRPGTPRCPRTTSSARSPRAPARAPTPTRSRPSSYEGYGPGGVAILVEALTDNRNRTGSEIRHVFSKHGGNLGEPGSRGLPVRQDAASIVVDGERYDEDDLMVAIDAGAQDIADRRRRLRGAHAIRATSPRCAPRSTRPGSRSRAPRSASGPRRSCRSTRTPPRKLLRLIEAHRGPGRRRRGARELRRRRRRPRARRRLRRSPPPKRGETRPGG